MALVILRASTGTGPPLNHGSDWRGKCLEVIRPRSVPVMPFFTIPPGVWVHKGFGRILLSSPSLMALALPNKPEYLDLAAAPLRRRTVPPYLDRRLRALAILPFPKDSRSSTPRRPRQPHLAEPFLPNPRTSISAWCSSS